MTTYVALLKAVNVGGKNLLPMQALKEALMTEFALSKIETYLQSGNVVFTAPTANNWPAKLEAAINKHFNLNISILVYEAKSFNLLVDKAFEAFMPYKNILYKDCYVSFLQHNITQQATEKIKEKLQDTEWLHSHNNTVFLYCQNGYGKTKITNTFIEKNANTLATTRNMATCQKLLQIINQ